MNDTLEEVLIARVVDRTDRPVDWTELDQLAERDVEVWGRVLATLRTECHLRTGGEEILAAASAVDLPLETVPRRARRAGPAARPWRWGAAAAVLVAVGFLLARVPWGDSRGESAPAVGLEGLVANGTGPGEGGEAIPVAHSLDDSWKAYVDATRREGVYLREMVPVVLETRPNPDGEGFEVTFLRGVVQRDVVDSLYEVGEDELGRPMPQAVDPQRFARKVSL